MRVIPEFFRNLARGPRVSRFLARFGIDARIYWLLVDLFGELSERGEMLDQLGQNGVALKAVAWFYFAISALIAVALAAIGGRPVVYFATFLLLTAFFLLAALLSEAANSLVNPAEGLVLAHQPINGSTYTAAKLTHLVRIVVYIVFSMNIPPALCGFLLKGTAWWFPAAHLAAAFALGLLCALLCCAAFGWLILVLPPRRLKAAGQFAGALPFVGMMFFSSVEKRLRHVQIPNWLSVQPSAQWALAITGILAAAAIVLMGIRALSTDYLIRVSSMMQGGSGSRRRISRRPLEALTGRFAGPAGRAGFAYLSRMMLRDWQFRRQLMPVIACVLMASLPLVVSGWKLDPFSERFSPMHVLPHACGIVLFSVCMLLPFGADYKGAWVFLIAPAQALRGFARGIHSLLWTRMVLAPHLILWPVFAWYWGVGHSALFVIYSAAVASLALALELRLIDDVPFTKPFDNSRGATFLPIMFVGVMTMAVVVGLQHYFLFRSPLAVASAALIAGAAAWWLTKVSLTSLEESMRYSLGLLSAEAGDLYKEIL